MKEYIKGFYARDDRHLQVINKESNRKILEVLKNAYPVGLDVYKIAKAANLPLKTIYAQKAELYREYYINNIGETSSSATAPSRGRPRVQKEEEQESQRNRKRIVMEEASGVHDIYEGKKPTPLPPGNVIYSDGFVEAWQTIVEKEEENDLCITLLKFLEKIVNRVNEHDDKELREKWAPEKNLDHCCSECGLHHEARDFVRAVMLHLIDQLEKYPMFIDFMKENKFLKQDAYERIVERKERKKRKKEK
jgi:hypothetical protein